jgi:SAM-dependent methyltransferase
MPFPSGSFDLAVGSLGDGYCYPTALAEIRRVLKRNGRFYFSAPSGVWASGLRLSGDIDKTQFKVPDGSNADVFSFAFPLAELVALFGRCGYKIIQAEEICGKDFPEGLEISPAPAVSEFVTSKRGINTLQG